MCPRENLIRVEMANSTNVRLLGTPIRSRGYLSQVEKAQYKLTLIEK